MNGNLAYQDERREELIGGTIVAMSPRPSFNHNQVSSNIYNLFANHLKRKTCTPIADGTDLFLDKDNQFIPDFMIVCDRSKIRHDGVHGAPDLVVEVLSPSTTKNDRSVKMDAYARCGVGEYWLVNPADRSIEVYRINGTEFVLHEVYALRPDWELERMSEDERAELVTQFQCGLYDDLDISLDDVFSGLLP